MMLALALTATVAYLSSNSAAVLEWLTGTRYAFPILLVAQVGLVITLATALERLSRTVGILFFLLYATLTGLTFSSLFLLYAQGTIFLAFAVAAGMFGSMAAYGLLTRRNLEAWSGFLFMSLIGIVLASVLNLWLKSPLLDWVTSYGGVVVFAGLAAYDHQKLKVIAAWPGGAPESWIIRGALTLYLDFINLFLSLLRILGRRD